MKKKREQMSADVFVLQLSDMKKKEMSANVFV